MLVQRTLAVAGSMRVLSLTARILVAIGFVVSMLGDITALFNVNVNSVAITAVLFRVNVIAGTRAIGGSLVSVTGSSAILVPSTLNVYPILIFITATASTDIAVLLLTGNANVSAGRGA